MPPSVKFGQPVRSSLSSFSCGSALARTSMSSSFRGEHLRFRFSSSRLGGRLSASMQRYSPFKPCRCSNKDLLLSSWMRLRAKATRFVGARPSLSARPSRGHIAMARRALIRAEPSSAQSDAMLLTIRALSSSVAASDFSACTAKPASAKSMGKLASLRSFALTPRPGCCASRFSSSSVRPWVMSSAEGPVQAMSTMEVSNAAASS
mmetsp:Transcript_68710/g.163674  ORF Transcript_68710/g.163674 Transcript_68710/m.163674 type:complete len:206 (-) Transcript_68710:925-1542(-)